MSISVAFGILAGTVSVTTGVANHSLSVVAIGLGVLADVTGSAAPIWRFRAERHPGQSRLVENRAAIVVTAALATVSAVITIQEMQTVPYAP